MPQFKFDNDGIEIEDEVIKRFSESLSRGLCTGFKCRTCPLSTATQVDGYTCGWVHAVQGNTEHLTKLQKEILACIAIFGRYPLEEKVNE